MTQNPRILLIYTGGTIGMVKDFETGALRAFNFDKLRQHIPELKQVNCSIDSISFEAPIDSSDMDPAQWVMIAEIIESKYQGYDGFVVLHGSDTMSYSASAISFMLENLSKPVIFTGSQLPIGDLRTDAKENLITSIEIAAAQHKGFPVISEVCLYFEYKLYRANRTTKINAEHFQAFSSPNYPPLAESGVHLKFNRSLIPETSKAAPLIVSKTLVSDIAVLKLFPGITKNTVESVLRISGLRGVILETYGAGNAPTSAWFIDLLSEAISRGINIVSVTQCKGGSVIMGKYEASLLLQKIGLINGLDITTESALTKMMYLLGKDIRPENFAHTFEKSLRGEIGTNS